MNGLLSSEKSGCRLLVSTFKCLLKATDEWYDLDDDYMIGSVFMSFHATNTSTDGIDSNTEERLVFHNVLVEKTKYIDVQVHNSFD